MLAFETRERLWSRASRSTIVHATPRCETINFRYCATPEAGGSGAFETSIAAGTKTYFTTKRAE
jgi:hypothetical protein